MTYTGMILAAVLFGAGEKSQEYRLQVSPLEDDLGITVLSAEILGGPQAVARTGVSLTKEGKAVPVQIEPARSGCSALWIAEDFKKGERSEWILRISEEEPGPAPAAMNLKRDGTSIAVEACGKLFTKLVFDPKAQKPYLFPILLDGAHLTRHYPLEDFPGEDRDHVHQKSFWFTHGSVNGVDFWAEGPKCGRIVQRQVRSAEGGPVFAAIVTENQWLAPDGKVLLDEERIHKFYDLGPAGRMIDLTISLFAPEEPVIFGDTKEGTFGIRIAESMKEKKGGRIENSRGQVGMKSAWGKPAEWVDYTGKIDGRIYGIAIFDHPTSFRHPTTWHVRDYGLFAANPFGLRDFTGDRSKDGSHKIEKGGSIAFRYRVYFHQGSTDEAKVAAAYRAFANPPEVKVEKVR